MKTDHQIKKIYLVRFFIVSFLMLPLVFAQGGWCEETLGRGLKSNTSLARLQVEQAWETYHHAALGGTLSSPGSQTELEMNLHKSRALLAEAYEAEDSGDMKTAHKLIKQIMQITDKVIVESQESKK